MKNRKRQPGVNLSEPATVTVEGPNASVMSRLLPAGFAALCVLTPLIPPQRPMPIRGKHHTGGGLVALAADLVGRLLLEHRDHSPFFSLGRPVAAAGHLAQYEAHGKRRVLQRATCLE